MNLGFFSICAKNYIPYARTLFQSLRAQYGDVSFYLILADRVDGSFDPAAEEFHVLEAESLGIDDFSGMAFRYDITEFNTAIKPACFEFLFNSGQHDALIYLDPDVYVVNRLQDVESLLANSAEAVVTPHICAPLEDGEKPDDLTIMRGGIYNLGFLALADSPEVRAFLRWWGRRLKHDCRMDLNEGLHVDQKWVDLLPAFVERTVILRHPGYNVAYWNLMHRTIRNTSEGWRANRSPLVFVHFSGVESPDPKVFSKHQNRFNADNIGDLKELLLNYRTKAEENGGTEFSNLPYAYGISSSGHRIHPLVRHIYREEVETLKAKQAEPWASTVKHCNAAASQVAQDPQLLITRLMHRIWHDRPDLQTAFDLGTTVGRRGFVEWYMHSATREIGLDPLFVADVTERYCTAPTGTVPTVGVGTPATMTPGSADLRRRVSLWLLNVAPRLRPLYRHLPIQLRRRIKARLLRRAFRTAASSKDPAFSPVTASAKITDAGPSGPADTVQSRSKEISPATTALAPGVLLVGYPRAELGMGEHVRLSARSFAETAAEFGIFDFNYNVVARQYDDRFVHYVTAEARFGTNIFHINADQMEVALTALGREFFAGRYNIGYWTWELGEFPDVWLPAQDLVDEVWTPSRFVQQAIAEKVRCPVVYMPLAVDVTVPEDIRRKDFGLPDGAFVFLFYFDFASYASRKNPMGVIEAFRRAFGNGNSNVILVIKAIGFDRHKKELQELQEVIDNDPRIVLIDRVLSYEEIAGLVNCCDAFVSLHRSEGFGRGMAEAMALGKPVIATNYSGNTDFMQASNSCPVDYRLIPVEKGQYPYGDGQVWADPDIDQASGYMRRLVDDAEYRNKIGLAAKSYMQEHHNPRVIGDRYVRRLRYLQRI